MQPGQNPMRGPVTMRSMLMLEWPPSTLDDIVEWGGDDDDIVTTFCAALEVRKDRIPWYGEGPMRLDLMCKDTREGPLSIPLHPAAERFWRARGYLS